MIIDRLSVAKSSVDNRREPGLLLRRDCQKKTKYCSIFIFKTECSQFEEPLLLELGLETALLA